MEPEQEDTRIRSGNRRVFSLGSVLVGSLILLQVVTIGLMLGFAYVASETAIRDQSRLALASRMRLLTNDFDELIRAAERTTMVLAQVVGSETFDVESDLVLERLLFDVLQNPPSMQRAFFTRPDGSYVQVIRDKDGANFRSFVRKSGSENVVFIQRDAFFAPLSREVRKPLPSDPDPLFHEADPRDVDNLQWRYSEPEPKQGFSNVAVTAAISKNNEFIGTTGTELALWQFGELLRGINAGLSQTSTVQTATGKTLVMANSSTYREGEGLTPMDDEIVGAVFTGYADSGLPLSTEWVATGSSGQSMRYIAQLERRDLSDLTLLLSLHAPKTDIVDGLQQGQRMIIWLAALVLLLTGPLSILIANRIRRPLLSFARTSSEWSTANDPSTMLISPPYKELESAGRVLAEEIIQRRNFQSAYERTFNVSSKGMARVDLPGLSFLHVNDQLTTMLGGTERSLLRQSLFKALGKSNRKPLERLRSRLMRDEEASFEFRLEMANKAEKWIRISALLIRKHNGEPNHAIVVFEDIDAARRVSEQLEDLRRDLQHVGRINMMGQFAAGLAHELNQPLSAIMHDIDSAQVLIAQDAASTTEISDVLKDISSHAERSGEIIRALRDLIQNDRTGVKPFLLQKLLEQTVVIMEPEAKAYGAQIVIRIDKGLLAVANRSQIAQVLVNLIRNALEASTRDPVIACVVTIKATVKDDRLHIFVEDNGPGIPKHLTPFSQFASTRPGGMGLGLSICKSLVEANDGSIWYEEMNPRGTRFIISLPCDFEAIEETGK